MGIEGIKFDFTDNEMITANKVSEYCNWPAVTAALRKGELKATVIGLAGDKRRYAIKGSDAIEWLSTQKNAHARRHRDRDWSTKRDPQSYKPRFTEYVPVEEPSIGNIVVEKNGIKFTVSDAVGLKTIIKALGGNNE